MASVLVIDDDFLMRKVLLRVLEDHSLALAENGRRHLEIFSLALFDLVITDILMPEADEFRVGCKLRRQGSRTRILAMSGRRGGGIDAADLGAPLQAAPDSDALLEAVILAAIARKRKDFLIDRRWNRPPAARHTGVTADETERPTCES